LSDGAADGGIAPAVLLYMLIEDEATHAKTMYRAKYKD
jgi:hypothetical protein